MLVTKVERKPAQPQRSYWCLIALAPLLLLLATYGMSWFRPVRLTIAGCNLEFGRFNVAHKLLPPGSTRFPGGFAMTVSSHETYRITWSR